MTWITEKDRKPHRRAARRLPAVEGLEGRIAPSGLGVAAIVEPIYTRQNDAIGVNLAVVADVG